MSGIESRHSYEKVKKDFQKLLEDLDAAIKEFKPRFDIRSTRLARFEKDLRNITQLDNKSISRLAEIVAKFGSVSKLLALKGCYNEKDLLKIVEGGADYTIDSDEGYNDHLFEMSMAARFIPRNADSVSINLKGECDIIIDDIVAIECKYIHSISSLTKNVSKAKSQIKKRIEDDQAKFGFIALDLSNVISRERIESFSAYTYESYMGSYGVLRQKRKLNGSLIEGVRSNRNAAQIISNVITDELETQFYGEVGFEYDMGEDCKAIILQALINVCVEHEGEILPVSFRGVTYVLNHRLSKEEAAAIKKFIHSLPTGI
ncbi:MULTISPECIES: hypothetical protein [Pseudomonas]|uniref:Uncharacterized protein n=1 Tax=Pseudomonas fulva TaxID=47880 RepID=A0A0D0KP45_9PSED|nr:MULTISPECIES: hypothetical protein [Pseudomonas]KIP98733.1 hypothetical protein RU08_14765 [Pseudomonas fulva]